MPVQLPQLPKIRLNAGSGPRISDSAGLEGVEDFDRMHRELENFASGDSVLSNAAQLRKEEILAFLKNGTGFSKIISANRDARLIISLYREMPELHKNRPLNSRLFALFDQYNNPISGSLLRNIIKLYFEEYDRIGNQNLLKLTSFIYKKLEEVVSRARVPQDLQSYFDNSLVLFSNKAPQKFVERAQEIERNQDSMLALAKTLNVPHAGSARFFEIATQIYYLDPLKSLRIGEGHQVLAEITEPSVKESIGPEGLMIGQHAAKILIESCLSKKAAMPDNWRDFILSVCSDPRVSRRNENFAKWWAPLESSHIEAMRRWLSKLDLRLFLKLLEDYAKQSGNDNMVRMLPARKKFLEGLLEENLVLNSRLILSRNAAQTLRRGLNRENLPMFATVKSGDICMIYLDLGPAKLVEGSHNFSARVYTDFNISGLADYTSSSFSRDDILRQETFAKILHSNSDRPIWQHGLIRALKSSPISLRFSPEKVLTQSDWQVYKREWGMN